MKKLDTIYLASQFLLFCVKHPELRFWQALRAWSGYNYIWISKKYIENSDLIDTFYFRNEHAKKE